MNIALSFMIWSGMGRFSGEFGQFCLPGGMEHWEIHLDGIPTLSRFCPGCGCERYFLSSGKFHMNANRRLLDVWLIYNCAECGGTWNMGGVARTPVSQLSPERLRAYEENDPAAVHACACEPRLFVRNQVRRVSRRGSGSQRGCLRATIRMSE